MSCCDGCAEGRSCGGDIERLHAIDQLVEGIMHRLARRLGKLDPAGRAERRLRDKALPDPQRRAKKEKAKKARQERDRKNKTQKKLDRQASIHIRKRRSTRGKGK